MASEPVLSSEVGNRTSRVEKLVIVISPIFAQLFMACELSIHSVLEDLRGFVDYIPITEGVLRN